MIIFNAMKINHKAIIVIIVAIVLGCSHFLSNKVFNKTMNDYQANIRLTQKDGRIYYKIIVSNPNGLFRGDYPLYHYDSSIPYPGYVTVFRFVDSEDSVLWVLKPGWNVAGDVIEKDEHFIRWHNDQPFGSTKFREIADVEFLLEPIGK
jgi:hypothetical protein